MSIATEISRLQTAKADLKTAIEAKGVTVPSSALISDYDTYVSQISGGGGVDPTALQFKNTMYYFDYYGRLSKLIQLYHSDMDFSEVSNCGYMFYNDWGITTLDFNIASSNGVSLKLDVSYAFCGCSELTTLPTFVNENPDNFTIPLGPVSNMFMNCSSLTSIPSNFLEGFAVNSSTSCSGIYNGCHKLRSIPDALETRLNFSTSSAGQSPYNNRYKDCWSIDSIKIPVYYNSQVGDTMTNTFNNCYHLRSLIFNTFNSSVNWKKQVIDLATTPIGYDSTGSSLSSVGFDSAKKITDAASYASLSSDPDSWTSDVQYAILFSTDSLVALFNSLPTVTNVNNVIKLPSAGGALTPGGGVGGLTSTQTAIATDKGWTVTIV